MANRRNHRLKASQIEELKKMLLERRTQMISDTDSLEEEALHGATGHGSGELSSVPFHMADVGSENYERELSLGLLETEKEELREIDEALVRLDEGPFGDCEECGRAIALARLRALPFARLCIDCKRELEKG